jgi:hypothetical protein
VAVPVAVANAESAEVVRVVADSAESAGVVPVAVANAESAEVVRVVADSAESAGVVPGDEKWRITHSN